MTRKTPPLPPGPKGHWLWGLLAERKSDPLGFYSRCRAQYGDIARLRIGPVHVTFLAHPTHVKRILVDEVARYPKGRAFDRMRPLVGDGLITSQGDFWKRQRRLAQPAFHKQRIAVLIDTMTATIADQLDEWQAAAAAHRPVPVARDLMKLALQVIARALFDADIKHQTRAVDQALTTALHLINERILSPLPYLPIFDHIPTRQNRTLAAAIRTLDGIVYEMIGRYRAQSDSAPSLLRMLMEARDEETGDTMTDRQLRDEVMTLLLAGHETTATGLAWALYLLEQHPEIAAALTAEVDTVLSGRTPTASDLAHLVYTGQVFDEALRLYPPVWIIPRMLAQDDSLDGYRIPKGDIVAVSPYITHRHPEFWPDAERFDPTRFTAESAKERSRWAYFPFGAGQRMCIGNALAKMEGQLVLAMVTQRFTMRRAYRLPVEPDPQLTLRPNDDLLMLPAPRTPPS